MAVAPSSALLDITVQRQSSDTIPPHHVVVKPPPTWSSYFATWNTSQPEKRSRNSSSRASSRNTSRSNSPDSKSRNTDRPKRSGFKNPWPSWHKPTRPQVWNNLEWGEDQDPAIKLAASHITDTDESLKRSRSNGSIRSGNAVDGQTRKQQAAKLLKIVPPDFEYDASSTKPKTTWLGHAGVLVQLPPLAKEERPVRCIFDPIFSTRASPSQAAGPIRTYAPPCKIESLPAIDVFMISHNHFDHLDYDTVLALWKLNKEWIRFVVPLGNKPWFIECGIDEDRVTELDWWDTVQLSQSGSVPLRITCTPSQHNSGRSGFDANATLWSSWYLEHPSPTPHRVFFAGDTGYQFHPSPSWPPSPPSTGVTGDGTTEPVVQDDEYSSCPAFQEIADRLGAPNLLILPIAVGASYSFLRSYIPLPDSVSPFPRHNPGLTGANHMPPWDAVRVFRLMTDKATENNHVPPVAVAMHWGTFVPEPTEVLKTLGQLEWACVQHDVQFGRSLNDVENVSDKPMFLALNHGQSVSI